MGQQIEITNPAPGGSSFTSVKQASRFVSRGRADMTEDGKLKFKTRVEQRTREQIEQLAFEAEFKKNRGDIVYWNGSFTEQDERGRDIYTFPPFCNVHFRRPGALLR